jgi:hypothetical protein
MVCLHPPVLKLAVHRAAVSSLERAAAPFAAVQVGAEALSSVVQLMENKLYFSYMLRGLLQKPRDPASFKRKMNKFYEDFPTAW